MDFNKAVAVYAITILSSRQPTQHELSQHELYGPGCSMWCYSLQIWYLIMVFELICIWFRYGILLWYLGWYVFIVILFPNDMEFNEAVSSQRHHDTLLHTTYSTWAILSHSHFNSLVQSVSGKVRGIWWQLDISFEYYSHWNSMVTQLSKLWCPNSIFYFTWDFVGRICTQE